MVVGATGVGLPLAVQGWVVTGTTRASSNLNRIAQLKECGVHVIDFDIQLKDLSLLPVVDVLLFMVWDRSHNSTCPRRLDKSVRWCSWCEQYVYHLNYFPAVRLFEHFGLQATF